MRHVVSYIHSPNFEAPHRSASLPAVLPALHSPHLITINLFSGKRCEASGGWVFSPDINHHDQARPDTATGTPGPPDYALHRTTARATTSSASSVEGRWNMQPLRSSCLMRQHFHTKQRAARNIAYMPCPPCRSARGLADRAHCCVSTRLAARLVAAKRRWRTIPAAVRRARGRGSGSRVLAPCCYFCCCCWQWAQQQHLGAGGWSAGRQDHGRPRSQQPGADIHAVGIHHDAEHRRILAALAALWHASAALQR
jgi:hypothetical protein